MRSSESVLRLRSILRCTDRSGALEGSASRADALLAWPDPDAGLGWLPDRLAGDPRLLCGLLALDAPSFDDRLAEAMSLRPAAVACPGIVGGRALQQLGARIAVQEAELGIDDGATRIVAFPADTPAGVFALPSLAGAGRRLAALAWDALALAGACRIDPEDATEALRPSETQLVLAAASCGVPALAAGPRRSGDAFGTICRHARRRGFGGAVVDDAAAAEAANAAFG